MSVEILVLLKLIAGGITAIGVIWGTLIKIVKPIRNHFKKVNEMMDKVTTNEVTLEELKEAIEELSEELTQTDDTSIKDMVNELRSMGDIAFRQLSLPAFRCTIEGMNVAVSDSYMALVSVSRETDLDAMDWLQFLDPQERDDYVAAFKLASENNSNFRYVVGFQDANANPVGKWQVIALRMNTNMYLGHLVPIDNVAREKSKAIREQLCL